VAVAFWANAGDQTLALQLLAIFPAGTLDRDGVVELILKFKIHRINAIRYLTSNKSAGGHINGREVLEFCKEVAAQEKAAQRAPPLK